MSDGKPIFELMSQANAQGLTAFGLNTQTGQLTLHRRSAGVRMDTSSTFISTTGLSSFPTTCTTRTCCIPIGAIRCPIAVIAIEYPRNKI